MAIDSRINRNRKRKATKKLAEWRGRADAGTEAAAAPAPKAEKTAKAK